VISIFNDNYNNYLKLLKKKPLKMIIKMFNNPANQSTCRTSIPVFFINVVVVIIVVTMVMTPIIMIVAMMKPSMMNVSLGTDVERIGRPFSNCILIIIRKPNRLSFLAHPPMS